MARHAVHAVHGVRIALDDHRGDLLHGLIPVLGILLFVPGFFAGAGIPVFGFFSALPKPLSYAGPAAAAWMVLGVVYLMVLGRRNPERLRETAMVFEDA